MFTSYPSPCRYKSFRNIFHCNKVFLDFIRNILHSNFMSVYVCPLSTEPCNSGKLLPCPTLVPVRDNTLEMSRPVF